MLDKFNFTNVLVSRPGEVALEKHGVCGKKVPYYDAKGHGPYWAVVPNYADKELISLVYEDQHAVKPRSVEYLGMFQWAKVGNGYRINGCYGDPLCSDCPKKGETSCQVYKFSEGFLPKEVLPC